MICRRRVAPRATACWSLARVPAARSRLWVIIAQIAQALFAANRPEGRWAKGAVDQVGEHGLDDRVPAVGDVGGDGRDG